MPPKEKPYLQFIDTVDDSELPPKGPLDVANSLARLDLLLRLLVRQGNQNLMALDQLASALKAQAAAAAVPGAPRPVQQLSLQLPGVQAVQEISPPLGHDPLQITVQPYKQVTPLVLTNPFRTQATLVNVGSNTFYYGYTDKVQPSGNPNEGVPLDPPPAGSKRGDLITIVRYTGPIYSTCDPGNTTTVIVQDVVTQLS